MQPGYALILIRGPSGRTCSYLQLPRVFLTIGCLKLWGVEQEGDFQS